MEKILKLFLIINIIYLVKTFPTNLSCNHNDLQKKVEIGKADITGESFRFLQSAQWNPIRIYIDYTTLDSQIGQITMELINRFKEIMTKAVDTIQKLVMVKRFTSPLKIDSCYPSVKISDQVMYKGEAADLIIFPYFKLISDNYTEASAAVCKADSTTLRPIAGFIEFEKNFDTTKINAIENKTMLIIHQIYHILAFNDALFGFFLDQNGNTQVYDNIIHTATVNGKTVRMIKTPTVLEIARTHFNCPTLQGIELEDMDGGSTGSHWESRIMYGDFMIATQSTENVISDISLALLEDSGWYKVNYYTGGLFRYGKGKGCQFVNSKCIQNGITISENEFPIVNNMARTCFAGRTAKGIAYIKEYNVDLPGAFQYFIENPKKGGYDLADYCPVTMSSEVAGWYDAGSCWNGHSKYAKGLGETIGPNSFCFYSSLTFIDDATLVNYKEKSLPVCHEVTCDRLNKTYTVKIRGISFECDTNGGIITVEGFDGNFYCADYNLICTKTLDCGNVFDCIDKKSITATANVVESEDTVNVMELEAISDDWLHASYMNYSFFIFMIIIVMVIG